MQLYNAAPKRHNGFLKLPRVLSQKLLLSISANAGQTQEASAEGCQPAMMAAAPCQGGARRGMASVFSWRWGREVRHWDVSLDNRGERGVIAGPGGIMLEAAATAMAAELCGSGSCVLCRGGKFRKAGELHFTGHIF